MRALLFVALAGFLAPSWATNTNTQMTMAQIAARSVEAKYGRADQGWKIWAPSAGGSIAAGTTLGEVVATTRIKGPSAIVGEVIDIDVKRKLPWASISKAVAKSLPLISTALAIKEIADAIRCREGAGGGSECDAGVNETSQTQYCFMHTNGWVQPPAPGGCGFTIGAAAQAWATWASNQANAKALNPDKVFTVASCTATMCTFNATEYVTTLFAPNVIPATSSALACPPVTVNGVTLWPVKGPDGKCMTNIYAPASEDAVATKAETWGDKTKAPLIVGDLNEGSKPIDHPFPEIDPVPASVNGPRETTTHPDGSTTTRDTRYDYQPTATGYEWVPTIITKDWPSGVTPTPPGTVTDGTSTSGGTAPERDIITCGLPDTPACKIDETGTPTSGDISKDEVNAGKDTALGKITELGTIQAPAWSWSFSLPTGCQAVTVGPFAGRSVVVDLCEYQPMIHDLVALLWVAFTVWACVGMVGRAFSTG